MIFDQKHQNMTKHTFRYGAEYFVCLWTKMACLRRGVIGGEVKYA
jgi:hypothetical protein